MGERSKESNIDTPLRALFFQGWHFRDPALGNPECQQRVRRIRKRVESTAQDAPWCLTVKRSMTCPVSGFLAFNYRCKSCPVSRALGVKPTESFTVRKEKQPRKSTSHQVMLQLVAEPARLMDLRMDGGPCSSTFGFWSQGALWQHLCLSQGCRCQVTWGPSAVCPTLRSQWGLPHSQSIGPLHPPLQCVGVGVPAQSLMLFL